MSSNTAGLLSEETVPDYLATQRENVGVFSADSKLTAKSIVGGNLNYAFRVSEANTDKTVFVKQAPEFVAIFGPDGIPLTSSRMQKEIDVYNEWKQILGPKLYSKYLPNIYLFDKHMMTTVMEFFEGFTLLDHELVQNKVLSIEIAKGLGEFMGNTHIATHSSKVSKERADFLTCNFENRAMRNIQLEHVFTKCYKESSLEQRQGLILNDEFMKEIELLKMAYNGDNIDNLVLCHGDLHPGSVMIKGDDVKVIDPEFTVYGPPGLDVGSLLSGYVLAAVHQAYADRSYTVPFIREGAQLIWTSYKEELVAGGIEESVMKKIEVETVGFAVAEVCRTALEFAGGRKWLQFDDKVTKSKAKIAALKIVQKCMIERHAKGIDILFSEILHLCYFGVTQKSNEIPP